MSLQDSLFSEDAENDIILFSSDGKRKRVLVFPPVNNYRRFLIHQLVQDRFSDLLHTFSIGQGHARRTVVCYKTDVIRDPKLNVTPSKANGVAKLMDSACAMGVEGQRSLSVSPELSRQRQVKSVPTVGIYRPPAARRNKKGTSIDPQPEQLPSGQPSSVKTDRHRRPDRAVYVPRHRRSAETGDSPLSRETCQRDHSVQNCPYATSPIRAPLQSSQIPSSNKVELCRTVQSVEALTKQSNSIGTSSERLVTNVDHDTNTELIGKEDISRDDASSNSARLSENIDKTVYHSFLESENQNTSWQEDDRMENDTTNSSKVKNSEILDNEADGSAKFEAIRKVSSEITKELGECISALVSSEVRLRHSELKQSVVSENSIVVTDVSSDNRVEDCLIAKLNGHNSDLATLSSKQRDWNVEVDLLNRDEVTNHKNNQIAKQTGISADVLVISDSENKQEIVTKEVSIIPVTPPEKKMKKVERLKSKPAAPPSPPLKINRDECDWDSLFDDNGDCLDPTLIEELTSAVGEVMIEQPKNNYKAYTKPVEVSNDEFAHVVEIYNFPSDFKTSDLAAVFSPFKNGGFELKWVDDTHCLGVFSSPLIAAEVLASDHPFVKTRPLSEATALSKTKARRSAEFLQPYRSRPETCAALARRLVTGALGVKLSTARQEREREKIVLREAKEKRRLANKQREDAWEGVIAEK